MVVAYHCFLDKIKHFILSLAKGLKSMSNDLYKQYSKSMFWNAFESICYQLLLLGHQCLLFAVSSRELYGLIGIVFSMTYLLAMITNFGLDVSISAFFTSAIQSKAHFKKIILVQLIPEYFLLGIAVLLLHLYSSLIAQTISPLITSDILILLACIIVSEGSKKTLRSILQLGFNSKVTAYTEVCSILVYIGMVWGGYALGFPISPLLVFIPLFVTSSISNIILARFIFMYYQKLPDFNQKPLPTRATHMRIVKNRFFNTLNQIAHALFSSNFLVPFFGSMFGLAYAGVLKLTASIAHCITSIIQKIFGTSGALLLSHLKNASLEQQQKAFLIISKRLNQILYGFIIFFTINYSVIIKSRALPETTAIITLAYLFMIIIFSENFFIAYEKFYITQEKAGSLFVFNLFSMAAVSFLLSQSSALPQLVLLLSVIGLRLILFLAIIFFSLYQWKIKPSISIDYFYFIPSLVISLLFFITMQ